MFSVSYSRAFNLPYSYKAHIHYMECVHACLSRITVILYKCWTGEEFGCLITDSKLLQCPVYQWCCVCTNPWLHYNISSNTTGSDE